MLFAILSSIALKFIDTEQIVKKYWAILKCNHATSQYLGLINAIKHLVSCSWEGAALIKLSNIQISSEFFLKWGGGSNSRQQGVEASTDTACRALGAWIF